MTKIGIERTQFKNLFVILTKISELKRHSTTLILVLLLFSGNLNEWLDVHPIYLVKMYNKFKDLVNYLDLMKKYQFSLAPNKPQSLQFKERALHILSKYIWPNNFGTIQTILIRVFRFQFDAQRQHQQKEFKLSLSIIKIYRRNMMFSRSFPGFYNFRTFINKWRQIQYQDSQDTVTLRTFHVTVSPPSNPSNFTSIPSVYLSIHQYLLASPCFFPSTFIFPSVQPSVFTVSEGTNSWHIGQTESITSQLILNIPYPLFIHTFSPLTEQLGLRQMASRLIPLQIHL